MKMDFRDGLNINDTIDRKPKSMYHTEVIATNELGEILFEKSNTILIGGRRFTLEKLFNITCRPRKTLNRLLGLSSAEVESSPNSNVESAIGPNKISSICLFGVGNGGSGASLGSVANPNVNEVNLYNLIPMRYVESTEEIMVPNSKYFMHKEENGMHAFYLKRFEHEPQIKLMINGREATNDDLVTLQPNFGDSAETYEISNEIEAYIELQLKIGVDDVREYYDYLTEGQSDVGTVEHPRINELALYFGYHDGDDTWSDYQEVEAFSKLTFNNESLADHTKEINIIYRIYI